MIVAPILQRLSEDEMMKCLVQWLLCLFEAQHEHPEDAKYQVFRFYSLHAQLILEVGQWHGGHHRVLVRQAQHIFVKYRYLFLQKAHADPQPGRATFRDNTCF